MNHSDQLDQLAEALAFLQGAVGTVPKTKTGKVTGQGKNGPYEYSYSYADLDECVKAAKPHLAAVGLAVSQFPSSIDGKPALTTWLLHKSGQWINDTAELMLAKDDPQGQGSGITYMRRYAYCAALGLVADEDDDGAGAQPQGRQESSGARPAQARRNTSDLASDPQKNALPKAAAAQHVDFTALLRDCGYSMENLTKTQASHLFDIVNKKVERPSPASTAPATDTSFYDDEDPF